MSETSTQIPTFVPKPDELLEPLGRSGEEVWEKLGELRFNGAALLSHYISGTRISHVNAWRKNPEGIEASALEILDALEHTLTSQRKQWVPKTGAKLSARVGFLGHAHCAFKIIGEDVQLSKNKVQGRMETWSISNWTCILMRQQLVDETAEARYSKRRRCWVVLPGKKSHVIGDKNEQGFRGCGLLRGKMRVLEFYEDWWEVKERFELGPPDAAVLPGHSYFSS